MRLSICIVLCQIVAEEKKKADIQRKLEKLTSQVGAAT